MLPERLSQRKITMKTLGIEPATFRIVVLCLKQLRGYDGYTSEKLSNSEWTASNDMTLFFGAL